MLDGSRQVVWPPVLNSNRVHEIFRKNLRMNRTNQSLETAPFYKAFEKIYHTNPSQLSLLQQRRFSDKQNLFAEVVNFSEPGLATEDRLERGRRECPATAFSAHCSAITALCYKLFTNFVVNNLTCPFKCFIGRRAVRSNSAVCFLNDQTLSSGTVTSSEPLSTATLTIL